MIDLAIPIDLYQRNLDRLLGFRFLRVFPLVEYVEFKFEDNISEAKKICNILIFTRETRAPRE